MDSDVLHPPSLRMGSLRHRYFKSTHLKRPSEMAPDLYSKVGTGYSTSHCTRGLTAGAEREDEANAIDCLYELYIDFPHCAPILLQLLYHVYLHWKKVSSI